MEYPDLNKRQIEVLTYIKQALRKQGYPPTVREIGQAVGLSRVTVSRVLGEFAQRGWVALGYRTIRLAEPEPLKRLCQL